MSWFLPLLLCRLAIDDRWLRLGGYWNNPGMFAGIVAVGAGLVVTFNTLTCRECRLHVDCGFERMQTRYRIIIKDERRRFRGFGHEGMLTSINPIESGWEDRHAGGKR